MKKIIALLLAVSLLLAFAACGAKEETVALDVKDATELMGKVWAGYAEDEKFPIIGGDFDHAASDGPDVYAVGDAAALDATFGLPENMADKIDGAASITHMMNANTFTGVAFHLKDAGDSKALVEALKSNVMAREWMCGFPDKLVVITVADYVISVFGNEELVDNFKAKALAAYEAATVFCDEPIL